MAKRKKKSAPEHPPVDKFSALSALEDRALSADGFASALSADGFRVPGPRKAWNILNRLLAQGLVRRIREAKTVRYTLTTSSGLRPVERRAHLVWWELTPRGQKRLEWLRERQSGG